MKATDVPVWCSATLTALGGGSSPLECKSIGLKFFPTPRHKGLSAYFVIHDFHNCLRFASPAPNTQLRLSIPRVSTTPSCHWVHALHRVYKQIDHEKHRSVITRVPIRHLHQSENDMMNHSETN